jgi:hypothetical protein
VSVLGRVGEVKLGVAVDSHFGKVRLVKLDAVRGG